MANKNKTKVDLEVDYKYKSVRVCEGHESVFDMLNTLPNNFKEHIIGLLEDNKDEITFIPAKVRQGLYICIYKKFYKKEPDFTLYVFNVKQDMLDYLERKPLNIKIEDEIIQGIQNL